MVQIKHLTMVHKKDLREMIRDFSLTLNEGDKAVIIGEEGNGKSSLLKYIFNEEMIEEYCEVTGEKILNHERIGYLPQELQEEEREKTVYEFFSESEEFLEASPKELGKMASLFGFEEAVYYGEQKMGSFSGGEKIKLQLLKLLLKKPTVLLLDEPSNDIDLRTLEWLERFMKERKEAILFVSHDERLIQNTANMVIHLERLRRKTEPRHRVARLSYEDYKRERLFQFEKQERKAVSDRKEEKRKEEKLRKIYQKVEFAQNTISRRDPEGGRLLKKKMHAVKSMEKRFEREAEERTNFPEAEEEIFFKLLGSGVGSGKKVVELFLEKLYTPNKEKVLAKNISLLVRGQEKVCIVGKNGSGKTTLLREILKELKKREGLRVEYMPQNYEEVLEVEKTAVEFLAKTGKKEEMDRIRTYLGSLKFTIREMEESCAELSGGSKAKLFLLKMSLSDANVLVLDEPTRNFSPLSAPVIRRLLRGFQGAIISVSHDRNYIEEVCDSVYELTENGLEKKE